MWRMTKSEADETDDYGMPPGVTVELGTIPVAEPVENPLGQAQNDTGELGGIHRPREHSNAALVDCSSEPGRAREHRRCAPECRNCVPRTTLSSLLVWISFVLGVLALGAPYWVVASARGLDICFSGWPLLAQPQDILRSSFCAGKPLSNVNLFADDDDNNQAHPSRQVVLQVGAWGACRTCVTNLDYGSSLRSISESEFFGACQVRPTFRSSLGPALGTRCTFGWRSQAFPAAPTPPPTPRPTPSPTPRRTFSPTPFGERSDDDNVNTRNDDDDTARDDDDALPVQPLSPLQNPLFLAASRVCNASRSLALGACPLTSCTKDSDCGGLGTTCNQCRFFPGVSPTPAPSFYDDDDDFRRKAKGNVNGSCVTGSGSTFNTDDDNTPNSGLTTAAPAAPARHGFDSTVPGSNCTLNSKNLEHCFICALAQVALSGVAAVISCIRCFDCFGLRGLRRQRRIDYNTSSKRWLGVLMLLATVLGACAMLLFGSQMPIFRAVGATFGIGALAELLSCVCSFAATMLFLGQRCRPKSGSYGLGTAGGAVNLRARELGQADDLTAFVQIQSGTNHQEKMYCCGRCTRSPHLRGGILNGLVFLGLLAFLCGQWGSIRFPVGQGDGLAAIIPAGVLWAIVGLYILECLCCSTWRLLRNMDYDEGIFNYVDRMKRQDPWKKYGVECYHFETRTITESYTDSNGNRQTRTRTETVKVVTWSGSEQWYFAQCDDRSGVLTDDIRAYQLTKIYYDTDIVFGDEESRLHYCSKRDSFYGANRNRDTHMDTWQKTELPGLRKMSLSVIDRKSVPCMIGPFYFAFFTFIVPVSIVYRLWLERMSVRSAFTFRKALFLHARPDTDPPAALPFESTNPGAPAT